MTVEGRDIVALSEKNLSAMDRVNPDDTEYVHDVLTLEPSEYDLEIQAIAKIKREQSALKPEIAGG